MGRAINLLEPGTNGESSYYAYKGGFMLPTAQQSAILQNKPKQVEMRDMLLPSERHHDFQPKGHD